MDNIIDECDKVINWYMSLKKDYTNIEELISVRKRLAGLSYHLSKIIGDKKEEEVMAYNDRVYQFCKKEEGYSEDMTASKAKVKAEIEIKDLRKIEALTKGVYVRYKNIMDSIKENLKAMQQHIADLRSERQNDNTLNQWNQAINDINKRIDNINKQNG